MLALVPDMDNLVRSVDIVIFGGSDKRMHGPSMYNSRGFTGGAWTGGYNATAPALRHSYRITISWIPDSTTGSYIYSFGDGWRMSDMGYPRVMSGALVKCCCLYIAVGTPDGRGCTLCGHSNR
jgi:hypothetical protein